MRCYAKYCPNVFVIKSDELHNKGDIITVPNKYGKEADVEIHNKVLAKDGFYYYSYVRVDGLNFQTIAQKRAERYANSAMNAQTKSAEWFKKAEEGKDFLVLAEPIKVGHHSEKRHRALIERNHNRMNNSVNEMKKAEHYQSKADYWESQSSRINLSMPESIEFYEHKLARAKEKHLKLKNNPELRRYPLELSYANKDVKEFTQKLETAKLLWGD